MADPTLNYIRREQRTIAGKTVSVSVVPRVRHATPTGRVAFSLLGLLKGMRLTFSYLRRPSKVVTQQYPENRETLRFPERYRARLRLKYFVSDDDEEYATLLEDTAARLGCSVESLEKALPEHQRTHYHHCSGCRSCERACPNGSLSLLNRFNEDIDDKEMDRFVWRMDSCTFCNACVQACPFGAIEFTHDFENAVYDRRLLIFNLNHDAGPAASVVLEQEDPVLRRKLMERRDPYDGPVPLNGHALPNITPLPVTSAAPAPTNGKVKATEDDA